MAEAEIEKRHWRLVDIDNLVRPRYFIFTSMLVLLGVAAMTSNPGWKTLLGAVLVAVAFHIFAYIQNDVLDLPIDKTQELRANDPLVSGLISPGLAMTVALLQIPISFLITWWLEAGVFAYVALIVGFVFMTIYNMYGKRCAIPMLTDAAQGVGWGSLAIYGSLVSVGHVNELSFVAANFGFAFLLLINGVHGGLRDLNNDLAVGCSTTAIYFGAHMDDQGRVVSTAALRRFAFFAFAVYIGPASYALFTGEFAYLGTIFVSVAIAWLGINIFSAMVLYSLTAPLTKNRNLIFRYHGIPLLISALIVFMPLMFPLLIVTMIVCHLVPRFIFADPDRVRVRWFFQR
jgi:4-hydroxybenzoate polyprenyltransferase